MTRGNIQTTHIDHQHRTGGGGGGGGQQTDLQSVALDLPQCGVERRNKVEAEISFRSANP
jgi:hypothetical protein